MNEPLRPASLAATTRAAEGLARRRFAVAEIEEMIAKGIIAEDERLELIGGEVVPTSPKGARHEIIRTELAFHLTRQCPTNLRVASEPFLRLGPDTAAEPDIMVYPASLKSPAVDGSTVLLVIEISDSSLAYDLETKASVYAAHGVREYWVINAQTLETHVHRGPTASGYAETTGVPASGRLTPLAAPELAVSLGAFDFD